MLSHPPPSPGYSLFTHLQSQVGARFTAFDCTKATLLHVSHLIEDLIMHEQLPAIVLTGFQEERHWRSEAVRYRALAEVAQQVYIFARGLPSTDSHARETRVSLVGDDPLLQEWFVCAVTPSLSFVLCGQDRQVAAMGEVTRQFHAFWTFDPQVVTQALNLLENVVEHYCPERLANLHRARMQMPPTQPDLQRMVHLLNEMIRFEDQLQQTIHKRDARYKIVSELTTDYLYTIQVSPDKQLVYGWATDALTRLTGYTAGECPGQGCLSALAHPDDRLLVQARLAALLDGQQDISEFRIVTRNGDIRWVRNYARPLIDRCMNQVCFIVGAVSDITERKRGEQALQQAHDALEERVDARTAELRLALSRMEALYAITNDAIASGNPIEVLQRAVDRVCATINADRMSLLIFDWEAHSIEHFLYAGRGKAHVFATIDFDEFMSGLTGWAIRERRPAISPKHIPDPRESPVVQQRRIATECGSIIVLPLIYLDEVFGTLTAINRPEEPDFTAEDVDLLSAIAGQIALAYARMRLTTHLQLANTALSHEVRERTALSQQLQQQAERAIAVATLSRVFAEASRTLQPLFDAITEQTVQQIGDACELTLLSHDDQSLEVVAFGHRDAERMKLMQALTRLPYPAHSGVAGQVVQHGQPMLVPQVVPESIRAQLRPEYLPYLDRIGIASLLIVPLRAHGRVLGTLGITRDRNELSLSYTDADRVFLQELADRAGLAIENARLFIAAEQARAEAERANRAKDEFLATMSHELRTPINAILSYSESLQDAIYDTLTERQGGAVNAVATAGRHLLTLINDVLDLAKVEAGRMELKIQQASLQAIAQDSLGLVREQVLKKGLRLEFHINDPQAVLEVDPIRLKQMLVNLLANAVKFTPEDGTVGLEINVDGTARVVRFAVYDTGIGIAPADLDRLFQPFSQLDSALNRTYEGTGLGLALVRRLAKLHDGDVTVESVVGQGSRFTITLPYHSLPEAAAGGAHTLGMPPASGGSVTATNRRRPRVLLVEDNEANIGLLRDLFDVQGCEVVVARDGYEALGRVDEMQPQLIVIDIQMRGIDGLAAIRRLRALPAHTTTPIIALTALAMPGDQERCLAAGATVYMTKPIRLRILTEMIQQLLDV